MARRSTVCIVVVLFSAITLFGSAVVASAKEKKSDSKSAPGPFGFGAMTLVTATANKATTSSASKPKVDARNENSVSKRSYR